MRPATLLLLPIAVAGCDAVFGIESPEHASPTTTSSGHASSASTTSSASSGTGGGGSAQTGGGGSMRLLDTTNMVTIEKGTFTFGPTGKAATITRSIWVDIDEVTVARFSAWVDANQPPPCQGKSCSLDPGGAYASQMIWLPSWNKSVPGTDYSNPTKCNEAFGGTSASPTWNAGDRSFPMVCVSWYQAVAFCAFEHKRLPTELEWEFAASAGGAETHFPWLGGEGGSSPDCQHATWSLGGVNGCDFPKAVGSARKGTNAAGLHDVDGSVFEWNWDWANDIPEHALVDYVSGPDYTGMDQARRSDRGGSWASPEHYLVLGDRDGTFPEGTYGDVGFRCVATK